jgi:hypothetical protein
MRGRSARQGYRTEPQRIAWQGPRFDRRQFSSDPGRYAAIVDLGGGDALVIGEGSLRAVAPQACGLSSLDGLLPPPAFYEDPAARTGGTVPARRLAIGCQIGSHTRTRTLAVNMTSSACRAA